MSGLACALGALVFFGLGDYLYKRVAAAGVRPHQFMMVQGWFFAPTMLLYGVLTGALRVEPAAAWGALAGFFALTGFYNFVYSLQSGSAGINAPVFRLSFAVTAALAIAFLGEPLTAWKVAGIAMALAATWLLLGGGASGAVDRASLVRVVAASIAVGIANFIYKIGIQAGATPASLLVSQAAMVVTLSTAFATFKDRGIRTSPAAWRHAPVTAIVLVAAFTFLIEGLARGEASIVVPIAQMGFVVTALLSWIFLREPFGARKAAGLALALMAIAGLGFGG